MNDLKREIDSEDMPIIKFVEDKLAKDKLIIPTFQREFVWEPKQIIKLWDSIYNFYPIGSILYWVTDSYLHNHREIGGFVFPHDEDTVRKFKEWSYILDGQQRATSLLVSLKGGKGEIEGNEKFDYTLYFDATKGEFFFGNNYDERSDGINPAFLIKLKDVPSWGIRFYKTVSDEEGFNENIEKNIEQIDRVFKEYKLVLVRIQGVSVDEVCVIFERINQEGKRLDPVDIIVARTYRNENEEKGIDGFYLRENLNGLKDKFLESGPKRYFDLGDYNIIQMVSICLRKEEEGKRKSYGITPKALENLTTEVLEEKWSACEKTIFETIKFLNNIKICGPNLLPYGYLVLPICYHLHLNNKPKWDLCRQWFYRTAFGLEDFRRADQVYDFCTDFFEILERGETVAIPKLIVSKNALTSTSYYYRGASSRAVLAILAKQNPIDFEHPDAEVLDDVYPELSQAPNLHHIYPQNFLKDKGLPGNTPIHSLMNICFLRAKTNIRIGDNSPLVYFKDYKQKNENAYSKIIQSHLIPIEYIERDKFDPKDYESFLDARADLFIKALKAELPDVELEVTP